jgi:serpin B
VTTVVHRGTVQPVVAGPLSVGDVADAQWAFGLDLLRSVCAGKPDANVLLSPASAAAALSLLYPASAGSTADDLAALLHLPAWSPGLVAALQEHTRALDGLRYAGDLDAEDAPDSLQTSNRAWLDHTLRPEPGYLDDVATALDAEIRGVDFAGDPAGATDAINAAVAEDTRGLIDRLFDQPLDPGVVAVLTNALHLEARWEVPFTSTAPAPFRSPAGEVRVDMMDGGSGLARTVDGWLAVDLPYRDGTLTAVAVLPPEGTRPCAVDVATLDALRDAEPSGVGVRLPRIRLVQTHSLLEKLAAMGLPVQGDYRGLGRADLAIDEVVQKAFLEVDERGTVAAAATGLSVVLTSFGGAGPVVTVDRPFLFLLTDTATRSPLFITVVTDPSA